MGLSEGHPIRAIRGALGFLSRLPVGRDERAWEAFRTAPWTLPVAGYLLGGLIALPVGLTLVSPAPAPTVALVVLVAVVALTGINHVDGVADLGDGAVVHGSAERRREVMSDTITGVGGALALGLVLAGLALAGLALGGVDADGDDLVRALGLVVAAEVAAKLAMATLVALGEPAHDGFGAAVAGEVRPRYLALPLVLALPAAALTWPSGAGLAALAAGLTVAFAVLWWANGRLDGVTGDVIGAANELARVVALHAGLVAWHADLDGRAVAEVIGWTRW